MSMNVIVLEMKKLLHNLDSWLDKSAAYAATKKIDTTVLMQSRLAPDMLPLSFQIQACCDHAKFAAARLAGKESPSHPDTEKTFDDARKRVASVISFLDGFKEADFEGSAKRSISLPRWEGKAMTGTDYLIEYAQPNFFFHLTTAYAILRHSGVDLGKRDYIGAMNLK